MGSFNQLMGTNNYKLNQPNTLYNYYITKSNVFDLVDPKLIPHKHKNKIIIKKNNNHEILDYYEDFIEDSLEIRCFCFNGICKLFSLFDIKIDRFKPYYIQTIEGVALYGEKYKIPTMINHIIYEAEKLSKNFEFIRIDFLYTDIDFFFNEFDFTPLGDMVTKEVYDYCDDCLI